MRPSSNHATVRVLDSTAATDTGSHTFIPKKARYTARGGTATCDRLKRDLNASYPVVASDTRAAEASAGPASTRDRSKAQVRADSPAVTGWKTITVTAHFGTEMVSVGPRKVMTWS